MSLENERRQKLFLCFGTTKTSLMGTTVDTAEVITILSDDEDCEEEDISCNDLSVLIVEAEDVKKSDGAVPPSALDEDLVITFSRRAEVLPHARYDCPIHAFTAIDCEIGAPVADNQLTCDQCFCYICDKLASSCKMWSYCGVCHCNSHKRSDFWNNLRNSALLGGLKTFNLTLSEIDSHLRHADTMLQSFRQGISVKFLSSLKAKTSEECSSTQKSNFIDYTIVYEFVSAFLSKADQLDGRAAAIMRLGAADAFVRHFQVSGYFISQSLIANDQTVDARLVLLQRVIAAMQRQMVMSDLTLDFVHKLQDFYKRLHFPPNLKTLRTSLCVRHWEDVLLVSVLKGQNVTGVRKDKGKKDQLIEPISVVILRTELLQRQHRYRELCRYLRVVVTDDAKLLQQVQDLVPFFTCMDGSLTGGLSSLFPSVNAPASRLTPHAFLFYFSVFQTATAPELAVSQSAQLCFSEAAWQPIKDAVPLPRAALVRFALRVQRCCAAIFNDSQCWTSLLNVVNTSSAVPEPSPQFIHEAKDVVNSILLGQGSNIVIPRFFPEVYPDQALLLLVTGALGVRIITGALSPALPVLNTFKENMWALKWLWDNLSSCPERLRSFFREIMQEMENTTDGSHLLPFLHTIVSTPPSSTGNCDHTYCSPVAVELSSSQRQPESTNWLIG